MCPCQVEVTSVWSSCENASPAHVSSSGIFGRHLSRHPIPEPQRRASPLSGSRQAGSGKCQYGYRGRKAALDLDVAFCQLNQSPAVSANPTPTVRPDGATPPPASDFAGFLAKGEQGVAAGLLPEISPAAYRVGRVRRGVLRGERAMPRHRHIRGPTTPCARRRVSRGRGRTGLLR